MSDDTPRKPHLVLVPAGPEQPEPDPNAEVPVELVRPEDLTPPRRDFMQAAVEAVLFTAHEPVSFDALRAALGQPEREALQGALTALRESYLRRGAGIRLYEVANGYQLRTVAQAAPYVAAARNIRPFRLSRAAVEALAIVAYQQPISRQEVEDIRGVDCGGILRTLLERGLLQVMGRRDEPGRPLVYGTTPQFLEVFGLKDLSDLPTLRDLRELQSDDPREGPVQLDFPDF